MCVGVGGLRANRQLLQKYQVQQSRMTSTQFPDKFVVFLVRLIVALVDLSDKISDLGLQYRRFMLAIHQTENSSMQLGPNTSF